MSNLQPKNRVRRKYIIKGAVQGIGFRPFVYRIAAKHNLHGWVQNNASGVIIEVEGSAKNIETFEEDLQKQKPCHAVIDHFESFSLQLQNDTAFKIMQSNDTDNISASILPDLALCATCQREMNDPEDRRYRYPFINCTNCGPRYTIMSALPYDRTNTSMAGFKMCTPCRTEYEDPLDRRFHAQPIACSKCGPHLELWSKKGDVVATHDKALMQAVDALRKGKIIALKGLGGFHLVADAGNEDTVQLLRTRKHRKTKPFALMYPTLKDIQTDCFISAEEEDLLCSAAAPIVLLRYRAPIHIAPSIAPGNPYFGVMLPYTPMHILLLQALKRPVIATSGNRANEPICIDNQEALERLCGIADLILVHNRPIVNRCDDSIARIMGGRKMILRRGRGYAPFPIMMKEEAKKAILAVGGHLKNTVAFAKGNRLMLSPHIGDLDTPEACAAHEEASEAMISLYQKTPALVAHDAHPDYRSTQMASQRFKNTCPVQHHYAHALSCMLDNKIEAPCFSVVWDGSGYGTNGTIWGGEFLTITKDNYERTAHFLPFPLPGGEAAIHDPRRAAFGMLYAMHQAPHRLRFSSEEQQLLRQSIEQNINTPLTSSAGRLFDGVSTLIGLCHENSFEGEAAMALEFSATKDKDIYGFAMNGHILDWRPMIRNILGDIDDQIPAGIIAARFHNTLTAMILAVAQRQKQKHILLTGGCFQNKLLLETAIEKLQAAGFTPFWHHRIPPGDGGLAAGQILEALRR